MRICESCGGSFPSRKPRKYCSPSCTPKRNKRCVACDAPFVDETQANRQMYCSPSCNPSTRKSREKTCPQCGVVYTDQTARNSQRFCSPSCRRKAKVLRLGAAPSEGFLDERQYTCESCGGSYVPKAANQLYCTPECALETREEDRWADVPAELSRTVSCLECGQEWVGSIPHGGRSGDHLNDAHGMTLEEYREKHGWNVFLYAEAARWRMGASERTLPPDFALRCSEAQKRRYLKVLVWNKGLTKEDHPGILSMALKASVRLSVPEANPFFGRSHTDESKELMRRASSQNWKDPDYRAAQALRHQRYIESGQCISGPHRKVSEALQEAGLWEAYELEDEVFLTLPNGWKHPVDIASKKHRVGIEIDGCFYHGCQTHCKREGLSEEWLSRIAQTEERDRVFTDHMRKQGWVVLRYWEHELEGDLEDVVREVRWALEGKNLQGEDPEKIVAYYRRRGFPYPRYSFDACMRDQATLRAYDLTRLEEHGGVTVPNKGVGMRLSYRYMWNFYDARRSDAHGSQHQYFEESLPALVANRVRYSGDRITDATMRTGLRILAKAPASFPALLARYIYTRYLPEGGAVLDPCMGFGGRLLGSQATGQTITYTGFDPWVANVENLGRLTKRMGWETLVQLNLQPFEESVLEPTSFGLVFTSPPHWTKELYGEDEGQSVLRYPTYAQWREGFLKPLVFKSVAALKKEGHLVLHVSDTETMVEDLQQYMEEAGLQILPPLHWHQRRFMGGGKRAEPLLVGRRG